MTAEILLRYLHFISILVLVGSLVGEHLLLKDRMTRREIRRLAALDGWYGLSAILLVAAGLTLWFGVGKSAEFYSKNWIFHIKLTLAILLGVLSIYPTVFFFKQRKGDPTEEVPIPKRLIWVVRLELMLLIFIPLCATLMAKGVGYFG